MLDVTLPVSSWPDTQEEWRLVRIAPNYLISYSGRAYSVPRKFVRGGYLNPWHSEFGYLSVTVYHEGKCMKRGVHQLVADAWHGPCPPGMEVLHGPLGKYVNTPDQLHYGTHQENVDDMLRDGTRRTGEDHWKAVLNRELVAKLRLRNRGKESFDTLAGKFDLHPGAVASAIRGVAWQDCDVPPTLLGSRRGERHQDAKLTDAIVYECRCHHARGAPIMPMSKHYKVSYPAMFNAIKGKTWKHVPMP